MIYERQWLAGATAPSSIFSCLYLHDLSKLQKEDFATIMSCILQTYFIIHRTVVDASCAHEVCSIEFVRSIRRWIVDIFPLVSRHFSCRRTLIPSFSDFLSGRVSVPTRRSPSIS